MCPLWPFHFIIIYVALFFPIYYFMSAMAIRTTAKWNVNYLTRKPTIKMNDVSTINFLTNDLDELKTYTVEVISADPNIAEGVPPIIRTNNSDVMSFDMRGNFLGYTDVWLRLHESDSGYEDTTRDSDSIRISVIRKHRTIDTVFTISVASLVFIIFINFGCALDWSELKSSLKSPSAPLIAITSQFIFMPLISFGLGKLLFPNSVPMQLGLFFTGICPSGGASNIWIYALGGNINLSVTVTALSTLASFAMMPAWTFTLGRQIFSSGSMQVPYYRIATFAITLIVPLAIGLLMQRRCPRVSAMMVRVLKSFSACLIVFIILFAIATNLYLFKLFNWRIILGGMALPWLGYLSGWIFAKFMNQPYENALAISLETGIKNTGIAIFMLRFSLGQPEADLTTVVPVADALMTPVPLIIWFLARKFCSFDAIKRNVCDFESATDEVLRNGICSHAYTVNGVI